MQAVLNFNKIKGEINAGYSFDLPLSLFKDTNLFENLISDEKFKDFIKELQTIKLVG